MEKKRMNDKGFSLVELIIVIAIMAILIGILAPQYLKFVERSRKSTDITNISEVIRAVDIYAADPFADVAVPNDPFTLTVTTAGVKIDAAFQTANPYLYAALTDIGITEVKLKSSKWTTSGSVTITFTPQANGTVKAEQTDADKRTADGVTFDIVTGTYK